MSDPLLGANVGPYRVERLLGKGGMGSVYLGVQPAIGARVALKVLDGEDAEAGARFYAEACAANLVRHEAIVQVLDLTRLGDGRPCIVMEFVEGRSLAEVFAAGPQPLPWLRRVGGELLAALAAAHAAGVVHRDLKPGSILITPAGRARVLDFGIAKLATSTTVPVDLDPGLHSGPPPRGEPWDSSTC